jgi:hypothetical protein
MVLAADPVLRKRALDYVVSPAIPPDDAGRRIRWVNASTDVDPKMAWQVFTANEDVLFAPIEELGRGFFASGAAAVYGDGVPLDTIAQNLTARVPAASAAIAASIVRAEQRAAIVRRVVPPLDAHVRLLGGSVVHPWHVAG